MANEGSRGNQIDNLSPAQNETRRGPGRGQLLSPDEVAPVKESLDAVLAELDRLLLGRLELHRLVLTGVLARGHILLEGLPGLGKTALVKALSEILELEAKRVQFTPDLMPADILGSHILETRADGSREMTFRPGPVFCNLLLADEINRASPKTQSALLETMQERTVTLLGTTRALPRPFFVLASQNPIELEGTYPLPEAQVDRFLFRLEVEAPSAETLAAIVSGRLQGELPTCRYHLGADRLAVALEMVRRVVLPDAVARWIGRLVAASHANSSEAPEIVKKSVTYGASPRAAIALAESARAFALLAGRPSVGFEDVRAVALSVFNHRLIIDYRAKLEGVTSAQIVGELLKLPVA